MLSVIRNMDWKLNSAVLVLTAASLAELASIDMGLFWKQLLFVGIGMALMLAITRFDWRSFVNYRGVIMGIYAIILALLALTLAVAPKINGHRSWIKLGGFQLQASVFAGVALIIVLASFFRKGHRSIARISTLLHSFAYVAVPAGLIYLQGDLASALLMFSIWFGFVLVSGIRWRHLLVLLLVAAIVGGLGWGFFLKSYQKERILGLFNPTRDVLGINYHVIQAKIAIGSGGLFGKGFRQGTQVQLGFLPEAQTDFIFSAISEEWGLLAAFAVIGAFFAVIIRIIKIGLDEQNSFNQFVCLGSVIFFLASFAFNSGSNVGLLPVMGVPFPFLSYGGSHILAEFMLLGMIQSIKLRNE